MASNMANSALDGGDPRLSGNGVGIASYMRPQMRQLHDPSVSFEEYQYYARLTRERENAAGLDTRGESGIMSTIMPSSNNTPLPSVADDNASPREKTMGGKQDMTNMSHIDRHGVSDEEWITASRAMRTATWGAVFYLITTDILGPFGVA